MSTNIMRKQSLRRRCLRQSPRSTSLGMCDAALLELRNTGRTQLRIVYDEKMSGLDGELVLKQKGINSSNHREPNSGRQRHRRHRHVRQWQEVGFGRVLFR